MFRIFRFSVRESAHRLKASKYIGLLKGTFRFRHFGVIFQNHAVHVLGAKRQSQAVSLSEHDSSLRNIVLLEQDMPVVYACPGYAGTVGEALRYLQRVAGINQRAVKISSRGGHQRHVDIQPVQAVCQLVFFDVTDAIQQIAFGFVQFALSYISDGKAVEKTDPQNRVAVVFRQPQAFLEQVDRLFGIGLQVVQDA